MRLKIYCNIQWHPINILMKSTIPTKKQWFPRWTHSNILNWRISISGMAFWQHKILPIFLCNTEQIRRAHWNTAYLFFTLSQCRYVKWRNFSKYYRLNNEVFLILETNKRTIEIMRRLLFVQTFDIIWIILIYMYMEREGERERDWFNTIHSLVCLLIALSNQYRDHWFVTRRLHQTQ